MILLSSEQSNLLPSALSCSRRRTQNLWGLALWWLWGQSWRICRRPEAIFRQYCCPLRFQPTFLFFTHWNFWILRGSRPALRRQRRILIFVTFIGGVALGRNGCHWYCSLWCLTQGKLRMLSLFTKPFFNFDRLSHSMVVPVAAEPPFSSCRCNWVLVLQPDHRNCSGVKGSVKFRVAWFH